MKRALVLFASALALLQAAATTVWKVNGTGGWNDSRQWDNGVPSSGNPAKFENVTLTFTDSDVANLNTAKIVPAAGATLVFDFANDQTIESDIQLQTMTIVLGTRYTVINKTDKNPCPQGELTLSWRRETRE